MGGQRIAGELKRDVSRASHGVDGMKFLRFDNWSTGLLVPETNKVLDLGRSLGPFRKINAAAADRISGALPEGADGSWVAMIDNWDGVRDSVSALLSALSSPNSKLVTKDLADITLQAPMVAKDSRSFLSAGNIAKHTAQGFKVILGIQQVAKDVHDDVTKPKQQGEPPWGFSVHPELIVGPDATVAPPSSVKKFDYEGEVCAVVGSRGRDIPSEKVRIWGFCALNDWSIRDPVLGIGPRISRGVLSYNLMKNFDTCTSIGPWLVVDEPFDLYNLSVKTRVNGNIRQDWNTSDMIYSFHETAAFLSHYLTMKPGDMIASGTGPGCAIESGVENGLWLRPGDQVEVEVEGAGILRNTVGAF